MFNSPDTLDFQAAAGALLSWLGFAVLYGSVLAAATWFVVQTLLRRARPAIHGAVWLVVLLKFIVPAGPGWSYSLSSMLSGATGWLDAAPIATSGAAVDTSDAGPYLFVLDGAGTVLADGLPGAFTAGG